MNTETLVRLIKSTQPNPDSKGKLFTVSFIKKDGTPRTYRARLGLKRNLKGKNPATAEGFMRIWSADSQGYRMLNLNTVTHLKIGNTIYEQL